MNMDFGCPTCQGRSLYCKTCNGFGFIPPPPNGSSDQFKIINMPPTYRQSVRERIENRIKQLRRDGWKWVKHPPSHPHTMCAVADSLNSVNPVYLRQGLDDRSVFALNAWWSERTDGRWGSIVEWNDSPVGAKDVDEVVEVFEKFVAEL